MKQLLKIALAASLLLGTSFAANAQQKFGFINSQEVVLAMPETAEVNTQLEQLQKDLGEQLELIEVEYNNKAQEYQKNMNSYSDAIRQSKEKELSGLSQRYEELRQMGVQDLQNKQNELMKPVIEKAKNAINKVGADGKFTMIFDQAIGAVAYFDSATIDVTPLVKAELGIK